MQLILRALASIQAPLSLIFLKSKPNLQSKHGHVDAEDIQAPSRVQ